MRALFPVCFESAYIVKRGENDLPSFVSLSFLGTGFKRQENIWLRAWPRKIQASIPSSIPRMFRTCYAYDNTKLKYSDDI